VLIFTLGKRVVKIYLNKMNDWLKKAQQCVFPAHCFICNHAGHDSLDLCAACLQDLIPLEQSCSICSIELTTQQHICGRCLQSTPNFDRVEALYRYQGHAQFLIQQLKFHSKYCCAKIIGTLMASHLNLLNKAPDALMAVPLHKKRMIERGFNQSELIAQHLHQQLNIPLLSSHVKRIRHTDNQSSLSANERRKNIHQAFSYRSAANINSVAIIDDVVTTGSTANELAKTLKKAGVKHVEVWVFARA